MRFLGSCGWFWVLGLLGVGGTGAWARQDAVPGSRYTSGRGSAMGDAFIPLADDAASALFYNPAGLGRVRALQVEGVNLQVFGNSNYFGSADLDFYKVTSLKKYSSQLKDFPGDFHSAGFSIFPNVAAPGFAFGILMQSQLGGEFTSESKYRSRSLYQMIPTLGTGLRLAGGLVRIGYSLQWVHQASGDVLFDSETDAGYNQGLSQGSGVSHTVGFALTFPYQYLPSLNIVARNAFGLRFSTFSLFPLARNSPGAPAEEPMTFDAAFSLQPKIGGGAYSNFIIELRDATNRSGVDWKGRLAVGWESSIRDFFYVRAGWGGGYPSLGIGLRRKASQFNLSWFSEELGGGYHARRDSRFMLHYQIGAF